MTNAFIGKQGEKIAKEYLEKNAENLHIDKQSAVLIDTCLNQDGDLASAMNISSDISSKISVLYDVINNLTEVIEDIKELSSSVEVKNAINGMGLYDDYSYVTNSTYEGKDVNAVLEKLNDYTDINRGKSEQCLTQDLFVSLKDKCPEGYEYYDGSEAKDKNKK